MTCGDRAIVLFAGKIAGISNCAAAVYGIAVLQVVVTLQMTAIQSTLVDIRQPHPSVSCQDLEMTKKKWCDIGQSLSLLRVDCEII